MLDAMRAATQGWIGRIIMSIVMGLIIISFAIWGIGDIFRGFGANKLAQIGKVEITADAYRDAYQTELQRLQEQARRSITPEEAHRFGLDRQVLSRLVSEAALDQQARALDLAISDQQIAKLISADPSFKGADGRFDHDRFEELLRDNGLTEKKYVRDQRSVYLRHEIADAVSYGLNLPKAMLNAIHDFQSEARSVDYIVLPVSSVGKIAAPSQDQLKKYFDDRKQIYATPEYRSLVVLTLTPSSVAKPDKVSDADAQKLYDEVKSQRFGSPEKRAVEQIFFKDAASAKEARAKIATGLSFDDLLKAQNVTAKDASLGTVTSSQLVDKKVAAAAFALPAGGVSEPVKAEFGTVLVRVTKIVPSSVKPFTEVAGELKREIALRRAKDDVVRLHDAIEDQRTSGKSLTDAAASVGLKTQVIAAVDATGKNPQGAPIADLANGPGLLKAAFASDIGVDNDTLKLHDDGYQWFEVAKIDKARQKSFDEARSEVEKAWRDDEIARLMSAKAVAVTNRLDDGESMGAAAAAEGNLEVKHARDITRSGGGNGLPGNAVAQVFNVGLHGIASARLNDGGRLILQVTGSTTPPVNYSAPDLVAIGDEIKKGYGDDILGQYVAKLERDLGVKVNMQAFQAAAGAASDAY